jgi:hypothetical protein
MSTPPANPASPPIPVVGDAQSEEPTAQPGDWSTDAIESLLSDIRSRPNLRRGVIAAGVAAAITTSLWIGASAALQRPLFPASLLVGAAVGLAMRRSGRGLTLGFNAAGMSVWLVAHAAALAVGWFAIRPAAASSDWSLNIWSCVSLFVSGCIAYALSRGSVSENEMADLLRIGNP